MEQIYAYAYCRYSSHNQDDGWSIESQRIAIEKYARANGIKIKHFFIDEAMSGRTTNRAGYQKMMNAFQEHPEVKTLLIHKLDRMHRKTVNQLNDMDTLGKMGIRLVAIADGVDTNDNSYHLIATIKAALAEQYSLNLASEVRKGLLTAAGNCMHTGGRPPYGYLIDADRKMQIDETKAPAVRRIFKMYLAGMSYSAIIDWLAAHGYQTQDGNSFSKTSINSILKNEKYCGTYFYDKAMPKDEDGHRNSHQCKAEYLRIEDGCPAIVSRETFAAVQKKMHDNSQKKMNYHARRYYPLNGLIYRGTSKVRFTGMVNYSKDKVYYKYRCVKPGAKAIDAEPLEESVLCALRELLLADDREEAVLDALNSYAAEMYEDADEDCRLLKQSRAAQENKLNHLMQLIENGNAPDTVLERVHALETEIAAINAQIKQLENTRRIFTSDDLANLKEQFLDYMLRQDTLEARKLIQATIKRIQIDDDKAEILFHNGLSMSNQTADLFRA